MSDLRLRPAVRALVIDEADRFLLVDMVLRDWSGWLLPGGGTDGEADAVALQRELAEETGLTDYQLGPHLWERTVHSPSPTLHFDGQRENVYLVRCQAFEVAPSMSTEELTAEGLIGHRWWTADELRASGEPCRPRDLVERVQRLLRDGPPSTPDVFVEAGG